MRKLEYNGVEEGVWLLCDLERVQVMSTDQVLCVLVHYDTSAGK